MSRFCFICDMHITSSAPFRTGNPVEDIIAKLSWVVGYCNSNSAQLLIGGDIFDKPTVTYEVFTKVCNVFKKCNLPPVVIWGNHDQLFRSDENNVKCSLEAAISLGVFRSIEAPYPTKVEYPDCYLTSDKVLLNQDKPQILMFHGFFNVKDGKHSFYMDDLAGVTSPTLVLLGHDHVEYDPVQIGSVTIYRIGSLFRNRRVTTSDRAPKLLDIRVTPSGFEVDLVEVPARTASEIFREVSGKASVSADSDYTALVSELSNSTQGSESFMDVVSRVGSPEVASYLQELLEGAKVTNIK